MYSTCIITYRCTCTVCLLFTDGIEVSGDSSEDETGGTISKTFTNMHAQNERSKTNNCYHFCLI